MFTRLAAWIDHFTVWIGERLKWLMTVLVILIFGDVLLRYLLNYSKAWITDLEWHIFSLSFLLAAAFTLKADQHVRVDIFYARWNPKKKAWIDLFGTVLLLIPWCIIIVITSWDYLGYSFDIREKSSEPGGLPARYVIKAAITIGFVLLLIQSVSTVITSLRTVHMKNTDT